MKGTSVVLAGLCVLAAGPLHAGDRLDCSLSSKRWEGWSPVVTVLDQKTIEPTSGSQGSLYGELKFSSHEVEVYAQLGANPAANGDTETMVYLQATGAGGGNNFRSTIGSYPSLSSHLELELQTSVRKVTWYSVECTRVAVAAATHAQESAASRTVAETQGSKSASDLSGTNVSGADAQTGVAERGAQ